MGFCLHNLRPADKDLLKTAAVSNEKELSYICPRYIDKYTRLTPWKTQGCQALKMFKCAVLVRLFFFLMLVNIVPSGGRGVIIHWGKVGSSFSERQLLYFWYISRGSQRVLEAQR